MSYQESEDVSGQYTMCHVFHIKECADCVNLTINACRLSACMCPHTQSIGFKYAEINWSKETKSCLLCETNSIRFINTPLNMTF